MGDYLDLIQTTINSLDEEGVQLLLYIAEKSSSDFDCVAKSAIHYRYLGNPFNFELLSKLIMGLEELEERKPHLGTTLSILQRLIMPLGGAEAKESSGVKLDEEQRRQHQMRSLVVRGVFLEIAKKRPLKAIRYLIYAVKEPKVQKMARDRFELIMGIRPWKIAYSSLNYFRDAIVPALAYSEIRQDAIRVIEKVIEEGQVSLIYMAGPLLAATKSPLYGEECERLLDRLLQKRLGGGNEKMLSNLSNIITANLCGIERAVYGLRIAEKTIEEAYVPLIYVVGPLLVARKKGEMIKPTEPLLIKIRELLKEGRKLGNGGEKLNLKTRRIVELAISKSSNSVLPLFIRGQMKKEGLWGNNDYEGPTWKRPLQERATIKKTKIRSK